MNRALHECNDWQTVTTGPEAGSHGPGACRYLALDQFPRERFSGRGPRERCSGPGPRERCSGPGPRERCSGPGPRERCSGLGSTGAARCSGPGSTGAVLGAGVHGNGARGRVHGSGARAGVHGSGARGRGPRERRGARGRGPRERCSGPGSTGAVLGAGSTGAVLGAWVHGSGARGRVHMSGVTPSWERRRCHCTCSSEWEVAAVKCRDRATRQADSRTRPVSQPSANRGSPPIGHTGRLFGPYSVPRLVSR